MSEGKPEKSELRTFGILLLAAILLEIFVFNFRSLCSMFYEELDYPVSQLSLQNAEFDENDILRPDPENGGIVFLTKLDKLIGNGKIRNVRIDFSLPEAVELPWEESGTLTVTPYIRDAGHDRYDILAEHVCRPDVEDSCYLWLKPADPVKTVGLMMRTGEGGGIRLNSLTVNAKRPFAISPVRLLVILLLLIVAYFLRPASFLWKETLAGCSKKSLLAAGFLMLFLITPAVFFNLVNGYSQRGTAFRPYQQLAEAMKEGQFHLLEEVPQALMELENPYDITLRDAAGLRENIDYPWDTVYYEGKYYCYFGPIPCVLFYLPVYALSGDHLNDAALLVFLSFFVFAGIWLCLAEWLKRRYPGTAQGYLLILSAMIFLGSGVMAVLGGPDAHDVPRVCGLAFVLWGLYLWQRSLDPEKKTPSILPLAAGSLCMALAVGCRPNMLLYSLFAIPFFLPYLKKGDKSDGKARIKTIAGCLLPYLPVALFMMIYNASRFGSILDFGYAYNLTVLDYTHNVVSSDRLLIGLYEYLLRSPAFDYAFPFIKERSFIQDNLFGHSSFYYTFHYEGLLCINLLLWCLPGVWAARKKNREGLYLAGTALVNMLVNICVAGVAYHYRLDFAAFFMIAAALGAMQLRESMAGSEGEKWLKRFLLLALVVSFCYHSCFLWAGTLSKGNTELYYRLMYMFR